MKLGFIGAGNMAGAIIGGVLRSGLLRPGDMAVTDLDGEKLRRFGGMGLNTFSGAEELVSACEAIVLAVKPQSFGDIAGSLKSAMTPDKLLISIMAGVTAKTIRAAAGFECKLVLTMPNTPLMLGQGATALSRLEPATDGDFAFAKSIFATSGLAVEIPPDKMCEIIPVNGSSPAFFYEFARILCDCAEESGIPFGDALRLVCQTMTGSAKMMLESGKTPKELVDMVCSPGGTTLAAMAAFEANGFSGAVRAGFSACVSRAKELSGQ